MDPNLKPDPEHVQIGNALWIAMGVALAWLARQLQAAAGYFLKKHDVEDGRKDYLLSQYDNALKRHIDIASNEFTVLRERIARLEALPVITEQRLRDIIKDAVDGATKIFQPEHKHVISDLSNVRADLVDVKKEQSAMNRRLDRITDRLPPLLHTRRLGDDTHSDEEGTL